MTTRRRLAPLATMAVGLLLVTACGGAPRRTTAAHPSTTTTTSSPEEQIGGTTTSALPPGTSTGTGSSASGTTSTSAGGPATLPASTSAPSATKTTSATKATTATTAKRAATTTAFAARSASTTTAAPAAAGAGPTLGGCPVFPADNPWNQDVRSLPVDPKSATYIAAISAGGKRFLHPDFGSDHSYGIPFVVTSTAPAVPVTYDEYGDESDAGPFPIPLDAPVEAGSDAHVLAVDTRACRLYELYHGRRNGSGWLAGSGAAYDLRSDRLRPDTWTSADAAGLPILPGLVRMDEVQAGEIRHALRFTVDRTQHGFIHPATHAAGSSDASLPPMGLRLRLRGDIDLSGFHGAAKIVLTALQRYGMIVADNGSSWFISGATDTRWNDDDLNQLKTVPGSAFDVVQTGPIQH